jgi:hypothetical protein
MQKISIPLKRTAEIKRGKDVVATFDLYPLPLGYAAHVDRMYPAPVEYVGNGVKNEARPIAAAVYQHNYKTMLILLAKSLQDQVETKPPTSDKRDAWEAYANALLAEFQEAGLVEGEVLQLRREMDAVNAGVQGKDKPSPD